MSYPLPDPDTPAGELYLDGAEWAAREHGRCWVHEQTQPAAECEACQGELTRDELAAGVEYARRGLKRWIDTGRGSIDHAAPGAFGKAERYGLALLVVAVHETLEWGTRWTH